MTAKEWLRSWIINKRRYQLLLSERDRIDNVIIIKTTYYGDDHGGSGVSRVIEEKYWSLIERKKEIDFELEFLKVYIKKVEDALEEVNEEYPNECDMMILRHVKGKSNGQIQKVKHYSINRITIKINKAEKELEKLLNSQAVI